MDPENTLIASEDELPFDVQDSEAVVEEEVAVEPAAEEAAPPEDVAEEVPPEKGRTAKYIDSLKTDRNDWRKAYFKLQEQLEVKKEPEPPVVAIEPDMSDLPKPKWENFETEEDYRAAEIEWQAERVFRKKELQRHQAVIEEQRRQAQAMFDSWLADGDKKYEDFHSVVMKKPKQGGPAITLEMDQAIRSDDLGHEIAYYLGTNPEESRRIAAMPPIAQIREIGKLSAKLEKETQKPEPRTRTAAPAPTRGTQGGTETPARDPLKMNFKDYEAWRNKQMYGDNWGRRR